MAQFQLNQPIETTEPFIEVTVDPQKPLAVGVHRFRLVVKDDAGNVSLPAFVEVVVRDTQRPTAVIDAESPVEFGRSFELSGRRSSDVAPGRVVSYEWTLVPALERPTPIEGPVVIDRPVVTPVRPGGGGG
ncbi:MAG: hypothetical protein Kow0092_31310 [Deferrisomatales bacterium]